MTHLEDSYAQLELHSPPRIYRCEAEWQWDVAAMPDHDLWCVLNGHGELSVDGATYAISPGSCWLIEPGGRCRATHDPANRLRVFSLHFDPLTAQGQPRRLTADERPARPLKVADLPLLEALSRGCVESDQREGPLPALQVTLYVRQILLLLQSSPRPQAAVVDPRIAAVHQAVLEDPGQPWSVATMASQAHLSRSQLTRGFKAATGRAPMQCVLEARMARACNLLRETRLQIGEIADLLGYRDIYYFSRQFKEMIGVPPSAYRRS